MTFNVAADAYDAFMGRYSRPLAPQLADLAGVHNGQLALDVGSGPGALTAELVARLGAPAVTAVDPSTPFVEAVLARHPGITAREASAEALPFADDAFDVVLAQLVVHFMTDPVRGIREMARVSRPDGVVAACVWDHGGRQGPLRLFWQAARELDPTVDDESRLAGVREGHLVELFEAAGLREVEPTTLEVRVEHASFDEWWEPFTRGVGPAGAHVARLSPNEQAQLRDRARTLLPDGPVVIDAKAWAAKGLA
jgi:SAM-dependent methyltransferase